MQSVRANQAVSITKLKKNPSKLIENAAGEPIAILNANTVLAYLVPSATYKKILDMLGDYKLEDIVHKRLNDGSKPIRANIDKI